MTGRVDYSGEAWERILEGPPSAGTTVITADRGGTFRESFSLVKTYTEARQQPRASELLDEIVSVKPEVDRPRVAPRPRGRPERGSPARPR